MTDLPILFSAPMVRGLLREVEAPGTGKWQTRRVLKPQPDIRDDQEIELLGVEGDPRYHVAIDHFISNTIIRWRVGDRLWVREQWSGLHAFKDTKPSERRSFVGDGWPYLREEIWYWADGNPGFGDWERPRVSLHMPRWASRLTLTVTEVRVQRVAETSEADAIAEGIGEMGQGGFGVYGDKTIWEATAVRAYAALWDTINGAGSWDANPWVAAVSFEVERRNIDA